MSIINKNRIVEIRKGGDNALNPSFESFMKSVSELENKGMDYLVDPSELILKPEVFLSLSSNALTLAISNKSSLPFQSMYSSMQNPVNLSSEGSQLFGQVKKAFESLGTAVTIGTSLAEDANVKISPWFRDLRVWEGTEVSLQGLSFEFSLGQFGLWNAKEEVLKPALALMSLSIPTYQGKFLSHGPFLSAASLMGNMGANFLKNLTEMIFKPATEKNPGDGFLVETVEGPKGGYLEIIFGNFFSLKYCIISVANINFSAEVDQHGFPIRATVTLNVQGTVPPAIAVGKGTPRALRFGKE